MYDIAIIGAGVVGGMIANALAKYDIKVCILEKQSDVAMGATKANSAIVHAGFDAKEGSLKARFNVRGSEMMEEEISLSESALSTKEQRSRLFTREVLRTESRDFV